METAVAELSVHKRLGIWETVPYTRNNWLEFLVLRVFMYPRKGIRVVLYETEDKVDGVV